MYKVKKHYYDGYAVFPCFKVKALVSGGQRKLSMQGKFSLQQAYKKLGMG